ASQTVNNATGHRVRREFVDSDTGKPVEKDDQVKGYEVGSGEYVVLEPDEIASAVPESDKTLTISAFLQCGDIDSIYFDRPYYLAPSDKHAEEAFGLIREGMRKNNVAAIAQTVLFRRARTVLIRAYDEGLVATTLNFDYEVRSEKEAFDDVPKMKIEGEMLDLAEHIIKTKRGKFDPAEFDDRYETALAELVKAKMEGKKIELPKQPKREKVVDLMDALRKSAGLETKKPPAASKSRAAKSSKTKQALPRRKAG
ncbi:Ku protein, partial [Rhizobiaceae sp. 2RAB30]